MANKKNAGSKKNKTSKKGKVTASAPVQPKKKEKTGTGRKIVITVVCVIMALAMTLPSLSVFVGGASQAQTSDSGSASGSSVSVSTETPTVDSVNKQYKSTVKAIEKKIKEEKDNTEYYLTLGDTYYQWGNGLTQVATDEDGLAQVNDKYTKAVENLTTYIDKEGEHATQARYERGLANFSLGETKSAIKDLEAVTKEDDSDAGIWANLGMMYQANDDKDSAREAYNKALEKAGDDEEDATLKAYVEQMLKSLDSDEASSSDASSSESESSSSNESEPSSSES